MPSLLIRAALGAPRRILGALVLLTLAGAAGLVHLELRTDGQALIPNGAPAVEEAARVREAFGLRDPVVVWIEPTSGGDIWTPETLSVVAGLSARLDALPGIEPGQVTSLATERRPRVHPGTLDFRLLFEPFPDHLAAIAALRDDVEAIALLDSVLVSADESAAAVLVGVPSAAGDPSARDERLARIAQIEAVVGEFEGRGAELRVVGAPVAEARLGEHMLADLVRLVPLAVALMAGIVWLGCRRFWGVALALAEVGAVLLFTFGVMGWAGRPVYLTTAVLPVILTLVALVDEIHVLFRYQDALARGERDPLARSLRELARPVTLTSITTAVGFLSFLAAPIGAVREFGVFAAVGIGYGWLFTLTAVPAALALLGPEAVRPEGPRAAWLDPGRWIAPLLRRPGAVLAAIAGTSLAALAAATAIQVQDSWIAGFSARSGFRRATERVESGLHGTHVLHAEIAFAPGAGEWPREYGGRTGPYLEPGVVEAIGRLEEGLRAAPQVGGVLGPQSHLATMHHLLMGQLPGTRRTPETSKRMAAVVDRFDAVRGVHRRREVVADDLHAGVVSIFLPHANYRDTAVVMERARGLFREHLAPLGASLRFGGDVGVSQAMIAAIVRTQVLSVALALAGAFAVLVLATRSPGRAGLALLPVSVAVLWLLGVMGGFGIPLGVATSTFCAITLGIGVDYAIHLLDRLDRAPGPVRRERIHRALEETAPAVLTDAAAVALGFGLLGASSVPTNGRLGALVAVALAGSALLTVLGLPALLLLFDSGDGSGARRRG